jgi:hypothetical protein
MSRLVDCVFRAGVFVFTGGEFDCHSDVVSLSYYIYANLADSGWMSRLKQAKLFTTEALRRRGGRASVPR